MATTSSNKPTYAIVYGFLGGRGHSRALERCLRQNGFLRARTPATADILIVHSAGYSMLPAGLHPKLIMYVGAALPRAIRRPTFVRANQEIWREAGQRHQTWLRMYWTLVSGYNGLTRPFKHFKLARATSLVQQQLPNIDCPTIFIANRNDPWPTGPLLDQLVAERPWTFVGLPGSHENLWHQPEDYVKIISYASRLLAPAKA